MTLNAEERKCKTCGYVMNFSCCGSVFIGCPGCRVRNLDNFEKTGRIIAQS